MNRKARRRTADGAAGAGNALAEAARLRRAGRLEEAERLYRKILRATPAQPTALNWLGALLHRRGRNERALELLERAARLRPDEPFVLFHLGEVCRATGRDEQAVRAYRAALSRQPGGGDLRFGLGTALLALGRNEEAARELSAAVAEAPGDTEARNNLANALAALGQGEAAEAQYRAALAADPGYGEAWLNLGLLLSGAGREAEAAEAFGAALGCDPALVAARRHLAGSLVRANRAAAALDLLGQAPAGQAAALARDRGAALLALERHEEGARAFARALGDTPEDAPLHVDLGRCLFRLGRHDEALARFRDALARDPSLAGAHFNLGLCLQSVGRFEEAAAAHRRAIALRPDLAEAHASLAMIRGRAADDGEVARLEALLARDDFDDDTRVTLGFALGRLHEARGAHDRAFARYRAANDLKARLQPFDAQAHVALVERSIATFDAGFFAARRGFGVADQRPVFIVGMPRSGTTLVEQILAAHPDVHGAGELDDFRRLVRELPDRLGSDERFPDCARALDADACEALARAHLDSLARRFPPARRITDKMPGNYLRLGLIAALLPGARVIHCRRDPRDTCLSCYFQEFAGGQSFSYDLAHLGLVWRQHARLMAHWRDVLPLPILGVDYEALIEAPERVSRRILAFCDLSWDARCLAFHAHDRPVRTASFWQVRQPIYATSVGRWRAHAAHLGPLFEALDRAADAPG